MNWWLYIVKCSDKTLYTGITSNITRRMSQHNKKEKGGAKYTAGRTPVTLVYSKECESRSDAQKEEIAIKKLSREEKEILIQTASESTK